VDTDSQIVKVAVVPIPPLILRGKQFNLKFISISEIIAFLSQKQHYDVIVYSEIYPDGYKITGKYNSEKKNKLIPHLRKIDKQKPIDMPNKTF